MTHLYVTYATVATLLTVAHHTLYYPFLFFYLYLKHDSFIRDICHSGHITDSRIEIEEMTLPMQQAVRTYTVMWSLWLYSHYYTTGCTYVQGSNVVTVAVLTLLNRLYVRTGE